MALPDAEPSRGPKRIFGERFEALLTSRTLPWWLALAGAVLTAPSLAIGFHLDDYLHRFVYSGAEEGRRLLDAYGSPFGIANGDPASNHWQIERGYAPWWTPPDLLVSPLRPLSALTHQLDMQLWPDGAVAMHAHSLLWYAALCFVATLLFRSLLGRESALAGLCALLYALDYTHGFAVGWIANRNAVISACLGLSSLLAYVEARKRGTRGLWLGSAVLLGLALLAGESSLAIVVFMAAYALCLEPGRLLHRVLGLAPHAIVVLAWQALYKATGHGARGSGLYIDPGQDVARFVLAAIERAPLVLAGEFLTPPAETPLFVSAPLGRAMLIYAVIASAWLVVAAAPLVWRDPIARFFALGLAGAVPLACATHPHSRLFYFVSFGAIGLLGRLWYGVVQAEPWLPRSRAWSALTYGFAALAMGFHLLVSPLLLPVMACSVAWSAPIQRGVESALPLAKDADLIVMSAPEYFYVKLIPMQNALAGASGSRRLRAISFGAVPLEVERVSADVLEVRFAGGLMREPLLELYRAGRDSPPAGTSVKLDGLDIEVTALTADHHIEAARFTFDRALEEPSLHFVFWNGERFAPYQLPAVGESNRVAPAALSLGF